MPLKDPEAKHAYDVAWREKAIQNGYGKALYSRRKQRFENERKLRRAMELVDEHVWRLRQIIRSGTERDLFRELDALQELITITLTESAPVAGKPLDYMPSQQTAADVMEQLFGPKGIAMVNTHLAELNDEQYVGVTEAGRRLGRSPQTIREWTNKGLIGCVRFGGRNDRHIPVREIERVLAQKAAKKK